MPLTVDKIYNQRHFLAVKYAFQYYYYISTYIIGINPTDYAIGKKNPIRVNEWDDIMKFLFTNDSFYLNAFLIVLDQ